jgi:hypothetical protein
MTSRPATGQRSLRRDPLVASAATIILIIQLIVVWHSLPRALDHDEGEHLRAAAWMASGARLYRDFAENHTPFLYMILAPWAPGAGEKIDATRRYAMVARTGSAVAGIAAVLCIAAIGVRITGDLFAILPILAALLATSWTWLRAVADVRSEPYTLLLFWAGALLVVRASSLTRRALLAAGAGIGLIAIADLWNPKWPLESLVILGLYVTVLAKRATGAAPAASPALEREQAPAGEAAGATRSILASLGIALVFPLLALCIALRVTTLRDLFFFSFTFASAVSRWYRGAVEATSAGGFAFCPPWLSPLFAALAAVFLLVQRRKAGLVSLLLFAAAIEVVFLYPYPHLWPQYLVMWACVVALLGGVVIAELAKIPGVRTFLAVAIVLAFVSHDWTRVKQRASERPWQAMADLQRRLGPGEAAWVRPEMLPATTPAGSYYWYAFSDQVPFSLEYGRTAPAKGFLPLVADEDLPPCRIARGLNTTHVRLLDERAVQNLPVSLGCMEDLVQRGALRKIAGTPIWEVIR